MTRIYRLVARLLILTIAWTPFAASAAMVGTDEVVAHAGDHANRDTVVRFLDRREVQQSLERMGVSPEAARARVDALTAEERSRLAGNIDALPAGALDGWSWLIIITGIVLYLVYYKK